MAALTGNTIATTYKDLLQVGNDNGGIDTTMRPVSDGKGFDSALQINNAAVNINGTFQLNGISLTKSATDINQMTDIGTATGLIAVGSGNVYGRTLTAVAPFSITNANGVAGNPTLAFASVENVAGSYGPFTNFAVNGFGQVVSATSTLVSVSLATIRASEIITETISATSNVNIAGETSIAGALLANGKLVARAQVSVVTNLYAANATIDDLTAGTLSFTDTSVSTLAATNLTVNVSTQLSGTLRVDGAAVFNAAVSVTGQVTGTGFTGTLDGILGSGTPAAATVTVLTASADSSFNSTGALQISKGSTAQRPTAVLGMLRYNSTTSEFEGYSGSSAAWKSVGGSAISNDTSTSSNLYPLSAAATSGTAAQVYTSDAKYLYKPSDGSLQAPTMISTNGLVVNSATVATSYTIPSGSNAMSIGTMTVASGATVTVSSGSKWVVI
tara:strand:- start:915 stop:2246 length:1332 start_codon:yes stop_codon:yes gene_type:complete